MTQPDSLQHRHVLTCPTVPASVRLVRETAEMAYAGWGVGPAHSVLGPALFVLSELVTNSVRHAAPLSPQLTVIYMAGDETLAFAVHDRHPHLLDPLGFLGSSGGLREVAEVTSSSGGTWTVRPDADNGGKSVWITLPL